MVSNKFAKISLVAVFAISANNNLSAAENVSLNAVEVVSTSSGYAEVDEAKVSTRNATFLKDVFRDIPGVYVGGTNGMNQKIYMRGVSDRGLNITIDGAKQNGNTFHHNADLLIDPDLIKAVEVEVGAHSVVNGSGALGGSVAFKTVDASDLLEDGQEIGAKIKGGYTSNNEGYSQSAMIYGRAFDSLDVLAAFKHYGYGFSQAGNGKATGGDGDDISYLFKASYSFLDAHKITLSTDHMQYKGLYPLRAEFAAWRDPVKNALDDRAYERDTHTINYTYKPSEAFELEATGYYTNNERLADKKSGTKWGTETIGSKIGAKSKFDTASLTHTLRYGFDYYYTKNYKKPENTTPEKVNNYSFYLEDAIKYGDFTLTPGVRYERHELKSYNGQGGNLTTHKYKFDEVSPALAFDYEIGAGFGAFASYAKVFRGPDVIESLYAGTSNEWKSNDDLKAATGDAYEIGGRYKSEFGENSSVSLIAKYYNTKYKNLISDTFKRKIPGSSPAKYNTILGRKNTGGAVVDGIELFAKLNLAELGLALGYTHQDVDYKNRVLGEDGNYLSSNLIGYRDQGDKYTFNAEYALSRADLLFGYNLLFFKSKNTISASNDTNVKMPSYAVSDIYATYAPSSGRFKGLEINLGLYNIFDKAYASHSQRVAEYTGDTTTIDWEIGRNFKLNVSYKF